MADLLTIGVYRTQAGLTLEQLAEKLEISKSRASELCNGASVPQKIARRLESISGIPWHRWMEINGEGAAA